MTKKQPPFECGACGRKYDDELQRCTSDDCPSVAAGTPACARCGDLTDEPCVAVNCANREKPLEAPPQHRCDNCGAEYLEADADPSEISDFYERVANNPGGMIPSGQCRCGCLMYPIEDMERGELPLAVAQYIAAELRARLKRATPAPAHGAINRVVTPNKIVQILDQHNYNKTKAKGTPA
jgi:hypothetical protein